MIPTILTLNHLKRSETWEKTYYFTFACYSLLGGSRIPRLFGFKNFFKQSTRLLSHVCITPFLRGPFFQTFLND